MRGQGRASPGPRGAVGLLAVALVAATACAGAPPRPDEPPTAAEPEPADALSSRTLGDTGLRLLRLPGRDGVFEAGFLVAAGPINDPAELPGLTEWTVDAALLATEGDPDGSTRPRRRALRHGGELLPVANGRVAGWVVRGPAEHARPLLRLLLDVALRPSFPATRLRLRARRERAQWGERAQRHVERAMDLAAGVALGLDRALALGPRPEMLEDVTRTDVVEQWRRLVRPERSALVVGAGAGRLRRGRVREMVPDWPSEPEARAGAEPCIPQGQSAHLVRASEMTSGRAMGLLAAAVPGPAHADRRALAAALELLGEQPDGPLHRALDPEQARRARPRIVDVGRIDGRGLAVLVSGVGGRREKAMEDLDRVARVFERLAQGGLEPSKEAVQGAWRAERGTRARRRDRPVERLVQAGAELLYGRPPAPADRAGALRRVVGDLLAPWRYVFVGLGRSSLRDPLGDLAPVTVWSPSGDREEGREPPRCLPWRELDDPAR